MFTKNTNIVVNLVNNFLTKDSSILDVCCGIGSFSRYFICGKMTAIDICPQYIEEFKKIKPSANCICGNAIDIIKTISDKSFDVITCIDGLEHFEKTDSIYLLDQFERIAKKNIIVITPEGANGQIVLNHPKNTWGIAGGDHFQEHKCCLTSNFFLNKKYQIIRKKKRFNSYNQSKFLEMMYVKTIS